MDQYFPFVFLSIPAAGSGTTSLNLAGVKMLSLHHRKFDGTLKIHDVSGQKTYIEVDGQAIPDQGWSLRVNIKNDLQLTVVNNGVGALTNFTVSIRTEG